MTAVVSCALTGYIFRNHASAAFFQGAPVRTSLSPCPNFAANCASLSIKRAKDPSRPSHCRLRQVRCLASMRPQREATSAGQENVWDYPRPPALEKTSKHIIITFNGQTIADTREAYRVLETSHPPVYYIPQRDIRMEFVRKSHGSSFCEWKGPATYWSVAVGGKVAKNVGWSYESPTPSFSPIKSHLAFYCAPMDACTVDGERAEAQPGGFYGGWVTKDVTGPFKGVPGSYGW